MSTHAIDAIVETLTHISDPEVGAIGEALNASFALGTEGPYWDGFRAQLAEGPLSEAEFRVSKIGEGALLSLWAKDEPGVHEIDLNLSRWGELHNIEINPGIPPEGTDSYIYRMEGVQVSFQFTHQTRKLRSIAIEWGPQN